jgi:hypothetical protein
LLHNHKIAIMFFFAFAEKNMQADVFNYDGGVVQQ